MAVKRYALNFLIAIDQLGNVLLAGDDPDETISSAVGRKAMAGRKWALIAERAINWMFNRLTGETDHCRNAARRHHGSRS